jgi:nitrogenase molybdenum-iron protein alpha chain
MVISLMPQPVFRRCGMSFREDRKALTREKRLSAISSFDGPLKSLLDEASGDEIKQKIRTLSQVTYDEVLYAARLLATVDGVTVVVHGAIGCAAANVSFYTEKKHSWYSTNLKERDTILGGDEKLRRAVTRAANETHAKVIFVVGTPVVAINNDDINSVITELEDELDVKIISIYTDGFKSKSAATGYDIVTHSLLKYLIEPVEKNDEKKEDFVNLISYSENPFDIEAITSVLEELGIKYNLLPQYGSVENIKKAARAKASLVLNPDEGGYLADELEEVYGVTHIRAEAPIGLQRNRRFFTRLGKAVGKETEVASLLEKKEEEVDKYIRGQHLTGKKVFLSTTPARLRGFIELVEKLGGSVNGLQLPYIDLESRERLAKLPSLEPSTPVVIANGQNFEVANVLSKSDIDYFISDRSDVDFVTEQGAIPVITSNIATYGYKGISEFVRSISRAKAFGEKKSDFYKRSWLNKSSNWYVKQEVR